MLPILARVEDVQSFSSQSAYIAFLDSLNTPYRDWENSDEKIERYWNEIQNCDTVYTTTQSLFGPHRMQMPVRCLITTSAWVAIRLPNNETRTLIEHKLNPETNCYEKRTHWGSVSEKRKLHHDGTPAESDLQTLKRCLKEEAGIDVKKTEIKGHLHPWESEAPLIGRAEGIEQDYKEKEGTPGLWHFNQIVHYYAYLPEHAYFIGWRKDSGTQYLSRWGSAQDDTSQFDPIPANFVHL